MQDVDCKPPQESTRTNLQRENVNPTTMSGENLLSFKFLTFLTQKQANYSSIRSKR